MTYGLGIYILNLLIAFLSPKIDPALSELDSNGELYTDKQTYIRKKNEV